MRFKLKYSDFWLITLKTNKFPQIWNSGVQGEFVISRKKFGKGVWALEMSWCMMVFYFWNLWFPRECIVHRQKPVCRVLAFVRQRSSNLRKCTPSFSCLARHAECFTPCTPRRPKPKKVSTPTMRFFPKYCAHDAHKIIFKHFNRNYTWIERKKCPYYQYLFIFRIIYVTPRATLATKSHF